MATNPEHINVTIKGFKDLGFENNWEGIQDVQWLRENKPEYLHCIQENHVRSHHTHQKWDKIEYCTICKILWHYDDTD